MRPLFLLFTTALRVAEPPKPGPVRLAALMGLSVGLHGALFVLLGMLPPVDQLMSIAPINVEMVEIPTEVEPEPEPEPEPEEAIPPPEPPPVARPRPQPRRPAPPEPAPAPEPPPQEEAIADFTGETLTVDGNAGWQSAAGSGAPMDGPIGQPNAQVTGRRREGVANGVPDGRGEPRLVAMRDLSTRPVQPGSEISRQILDRNFPERLRRLGIDGTSIVRIRIRANGRARPLGVVSESYEGLGSACMRTVRQLPAFTPGRDAQGEAVDTITRYSCRWTLDG